MSDTVHAVDAPPGKARLDVVLAALLPLSRSRLKALVEDGRVTVDGQVVRRPRHKLRGSEALVVVEPPPPPSELVAQDLGVPLLHCDDQLVVVNKPAQMVVHPARGHADGTLVNGLLHLIAEARRLEGPHPTPEGRPGIVHRLDRGTSGVLVVARTPGALTHLAAQFAAHSVERAYVALVWGQTPGPSGTVSARLARHPKDRLRFAVCGARDGKHAVTHWRRICEARYATKGEPHGGVLSLVECRLETGRTHQIRVHMHHLGLPLVGDPLYGRRRPLPASLATQLGGLSRQMLHAGLLGFDHPAGGRPVFAAPPPADFQAVLDSLGLVLPAFT